MDSSASPTISLTDVSVHFGGAVALAGIDLAVGPAERVGLLGRSGAGKSTLLRLLNGTVIPSTGTVSVFGVDLSTLHERQLLALRRRIALVAQGLDLPRSLQVVHNVNAGRVARWSTPRALASLLRPRGLDDVRAALETVDLGGFERRRTEELSGGEQQRVAIARALIADSELLLADEPVATLDPELAHRIMVALAPPDATRTSVISLHQPDLARHYCDRIIGLRAGSLVFDVEPAALTDDMLATLYGDDGP